MAPRLNRPMRGPRTDRQNGSAASLVHEGQRGVHAVENALEIDIDHMAPIPGICLGQMRDRFNHTRVIDQHVEATKLRNAGRHRGDHVFVPADIAADRDGRGSDLIDQSAQTVGATRHQTHVCACRCKQSRGFRTNAPACPSDQDSFPFD